MTAMDNLASGLGLMFAVPLLVLGLAKVVEAARAHRASRARLADMPAVAPESLDAGLEQLRTAVWIPAQRDGGERRAS